MEGMEKIAITAESVLSQSISLTIDPANPCGVTVPDIDIQIPVVVVWILPPGYQFRGSGVSGLGAPDFQDGRFDGLSRRRYRWTAIRGGSGALRTYSLSFEWPDASGALQSCVVPNLKIINRS